MKNFYEKCFNIGITGKLIGVCFFDGLTNFSHLPLMEWLFVVRSPRLEPRMDCFA